MHVRCVQGACEVRAPRVASASGTGRAVLRAARLAHNLPDKEIVTVRYIIREKLLHLGEDSVITDESGRPVYQVEGKIFSLQHTLVMRDMAGNEVATIRQHVISIPPTWEITRGGQELAEVRKKLFTFLGDRFTVDIPGPDDLEVQGNIFEHEFSITRGGLAAATVSKQWISLTATYGVEIAPGQDDALILACVLILDLAEDEEHDH
jgi:uncharacterized protein YxjI